MRLLYVTQWFEPEPALKGLTFAKMLNERGWYTRVATGFPNYPEGKVYAGYRVRIGQREVMEGIVVDRLPLYPSHSRSMIGRAINYLSFAASVLIYGTLASARHDVIYVYHPPITAALASVLIGFIRRTPVVVDVQDLWPDTLAASGMVRSGLLIRIAGAVCRFVYRRATHIVVQSSGFRRRLIERGVSPTKITVIFNWAEEGDIPPSNKLDLTSFKDKSQFYIVFAGTMGLAQGLDNVLDAAKAVAILEPRVQFVLVGGGVAIDHLAARIAAEEIGNMRLMPRLERILIADLLAAADVLLVHLKKDPLFDITIPSKTQSYLATGKPMLVVAGGEVARLVNEAQAGICVAPGDPLALCEAAISLARMPAAELAMMGNCGRAYYKNKLSLAAGIANTIAVLERAAGKSAMTQRRAELC